MLFLQRSKSLNFDKAEQKEKEKKHRERLKSLEIQREKLHKQACEEAARNYLEKLENLDISPGSQPHLKVKAHHSQSHRHSLHSTTLHQLSPHGQKHLTDVPQRSPSSDYCRSDGKKEGGSRLMKWLGLSSSNEEKEHQKMKQRRMSTFT